VLALLPADCPRQPLWGQEDIHCTVWQLTCSPRNGEVCRTPRRVRANCSHVSHFLRSSCLPAAGGRWLTASSPHSFTSPWTSNAHSPPAQPHVPGEALAHTTAWAWTFSLVSFEQLLLSINQCSVLFRETSVSCIICTKRLDACPTQWR